MSLCKQVFPQNSFKSDVTTTYLSCISLLFFHTSFLFWMSYLGTPYCRTRAGRKSTRRDHRPRRRRRADTRHCLAALQDQGGGARKAFKENDDDEDTFWSFPSDHILDRGEGDGNQRDAALVVATGKNLLHFRNGNRWLSLDWLRDDLSTKATRCGGNKRAMAL